ncbi:MAG: alkaline phosphatase PhoX, partial [Kovacikia sp.]
ASVNVDPSDPQSPKSARQPNSFVYRFEPYDKTDLTKGGVLQALQVSIDSQPLTFHADDPVGDTFSTAQLELHTLGTSYPIDWVTVHDTAVDGFSPFDANAAAKAAGATPFKRPENAAFQPGSDFKTFFFDPTGDTNSNSGNQPELAARGAWGSIFRVDLDNTLEHGQISIVVLGTAEQSSFDNLAFADNNTLLAAEDRGDTLHKQLNTLDSVWAYDISSGVATKVQRFLALGRDLASQQDAAYADASTSGFQNDGDNEPTGLHISDGSTSIRGLLGTDLDSEEAHWFITQQHGLNTVYEILT